MTRCECGQYPDVCRRYGHAGGPTLTCEQCHRTFTQPAKKGPVPKFCSASCRQKAHRDRYDIRVPGRPRIALRPYTSAGGAGQHPSEWDHDGAGPVSPPLDDIVVNGVSMFRMEDMGDYFWMCCYLNGAADPISFHVRRGRKGEPKIVVEAYEFPDVTYETGASDA